MQCRIRRMTIQNFKGITEQDINFDGKSLTIMGRNGIGKSTVLDAFCWCLFGKNSAGIEKFDIRPLNKEGTQIDNTEIKVSVELEVDEKTKEFVRIQKQKWVKNRATGETTLQGNVNEFEVDGYPVKNEKKFKEEVETVLDENFFKILTNPLHFPQLDWKKQRDILMALVDMPDSAIAEKKEEFHQILEELNKGHSVSDMKEKFQKQSKELEKKLISFQSIIDGMKKAKFDLDTDLSALELQKNVLNEKIIQTKHLSSDNDSKLSEFEKLSDGILELRFQLSDLVKRANAENQKKRLEVEDEISTLKASIDGCDKMIVIIGKKIKRENKLFCQYEEEMPELREKWNSAKNMTFDEESKYCELCGQKLPEEKLSELISEFKVRKEAVLSDIEEEMTTKRKVNESLQNAIEKDKKSIEEEKKRKTDFENQLQKQEKYLSELPEMVDISASEEYKRIQNEIKEKEAVMNQMNDTSEIRNAFADKLNELQNELLKVEKKIALAIRNDEIDAEIEKTMAEQRETGQKKADSEKMLYTLKNFIKFKMQMLSENIKGILGDDLSVKLLEQQMNGEIRETCEISIGGVPFAGLSYAYKTVAGLRIIKALQKLYGIYLPVFIDNAESINASLLPDMDCQLIKMKVSTDDTMVFVEE